MERVPSQLDEILKYLKSIDCSLSGKSPEESSGPKEVHPVVSQWDAEVAHHFDEAIKLASSISPVVHEGTLKLKEISDNVRGLIAFATEHQAPPESDLGQFFAPIVNIVSSIPEPHRSDQFYTHIKCIIECAGIFTWMCYKPTPAPFIADVLPSAQFHGNKILTAARENPAKDIDAKWWKVLNQAFKDMHGYVKNHHTTGLTWNSKGKKPTTPPSSYAETPSATPNEPLKPVPEPLLVPSSTPVAVQEKPPVSAPAKKEVKAKAPLLEKDKRRIRIENYTEGHVEVDDIQSSQTVGVYNCKNCTIKLNGKSRNLSLEKCYKVGVIFDSCISQVEIMHCEGVELQPLGPVPIINVESTRGFKVYFTEQHVAHTEIVSAGSSEMNILAPIADDIKEFNIPQQYRHRFDNGVLKTEEIVHE
ncbi:hypothetical protein RCL1_006740 [Eukaryota sp. TZLM3-RCL]